MTDEELVQLLQDKTPEELSLGEIEWLHRRLSDSPELRRVLSEQLQMEQYLSAALGRIDISVDALIDRAERDRVSRTRRTGVFLVLLLFVVVSGLVVAGIAMDGRLWPGRRVSNATSSNHAGAANATGQSQTGGLPNGADSDAFVSDDRSSDHDSRGDAVGNEDGKGAHTSPDGDSPEEQPLPPEIVVQAEDFARGNLVARSYEVGETTARVAESSRLHAFAEYDVTALRDGEYRLWLSYASLESRPLKVLVDGRTVVEQTAVQQTGGWDVSHIQRIQACVLSLSGGRHVVRFEADRGVPLFDQWTLEPLPSRVADEAEPPDLVDQAGDDGAAEAPATKPDDDGPPWQVALQAEPIPFAYAWRNAVDDAGGAWSRDEMNRWFKTADGVHSRISERDIDSFRYGQIEGTTRLLAPLPENTVMRITPAYEEKLKLHLFCGNTGVTFTHYASWEMSWAGYATTRDPGRPQPKTYSLADVDPFHAPRCEVRYGKSYLVWYRNGEVTLSIGDIVILRAPLPGPPEEIFFEGKLCFDEIALIPARDFPPPAWSHRVTAECSRPAMLPWVEDLPEKSSFTKNDDGSVELKSERVGDYALVATELPRAGITMVEARVDEVSPGAAVYLAPEPKLRDDGSIEEPVGKPLILASFIKNRASGRLVMKTRGNWERGDEDDVGRLEDKYVSCVVAPFWIRLLAAPDGAKLFLSSDGIHWSGAIEMHHHNKPGLCYLGLACHPYAAAPKIRLSRIVCRQLEHFSALADADLLQRAPALPKAANANHWMSQVFESCPPGADLSRWCSACALNTLSASPPHALAFDLANMLLDGDAYDTLSPKEKLQVLDEAGLYLDFWNVDQNEQTKTEFKRFLDRYMAVCWQPFGDEFPRPASRLRKALMSSGIAGRKEYKAFDADAIRREILELVYRQRWEELDCLCREIQFFIGSRDNEWETAPLLAWARSMTVRELGQDENRAAYPWRPLWRHPLIEEWSKEAYNFQSALRAAIDAGDIDEACQMMTLVDPHAVSGLAPSSRDPQLRISLRAAIVSAMNLHPEFSTVMNERFGPLAQLRVRRAINEGDEDAVELATYQFYGTAAASEAHRWLGDRALSMGHFSDALAHYQETAGHGNAAIQAEQAPRLRLASAMLGRDYGKPIQGTVKFGDVTMSGGEFEAVVADMLKTHAGATLTVDWTGPAVAGVPVPNPVGLEVQKRTKWEGTTGDHPQYAYPTLREKRLDWVDRQFAGEIVDGQLYLSNRFQVISYDLGSGAQRWRFCRRPRRPRQFTLVASHSHAPPDRRQLDVRPHGQPQGNRPLRAGSTIRQALMETSGGRRGNFLRSDRDSRRTQGSDRPPRRHRFICPRVDHVRRENRQGSGSASDARTGRHVVEAPPLRVDSRGRHRPGVAGRHRDGLRHGRAGAVGPPSAVGHRLLTTPVGEGSSSRRRWSTARRPLCYSRASTPSSASKLPPAGFSGGGQYPKRFDCSAWRAVGLSCKHGTDLNGSTRIPAKRCGVRPSRNLSTRPSATTTPSSSRSETNRRKMENRFPSLFGSIRRRESRSHVHHWSRSETWCRSWARCSFTATAFGFSSDTEMIGKEKSSSWFPRANRRRRARRPKPPHLGADWYPRRLTQPPSGYFLDGRRCVSRRKTILAPSRNSPASETLLKLVAAENTAAVLSCDAAIPATDHPRLQLRVRTSGGHPWRVSVLFSGNPLFVKRVNDGGDGTEVARSVRRFDVRGGGAGTVGRKGRMRRRGGNVRDFFQAT